MRSHIVLCLLVVFLGLSKANFVGGPSTLTERQFSDVSEIGFDIKLLINSGFKKSVAGTNQNAMKYLSYVCGTKQVVAGFKYQVEFLACLQKNNGDCEREIAPSKCIVTYVSQPWLVRGAPSFDGTKSCTQIKANDLGSVAECSLMHTKKTSNHNNLLSPTLTMEKSSEYDDDVKAEFDKFIQKYNKPYKNPSSDEYHIRYNIFAKNLKIVRDLNKLELGSATYGVTEFMDYSDEEYKRYLAPGLMERKVDIRQIDESEIEVGNLPASCDWRKMGAVTEVKNQGQCGSCWAFSTTGNIEGQWFIAKKQLVSLSEQELVDCDTVDQGCDGGLPSNAYKQIEKLGGLETEKQYPYEGDDDKCKFKASVIRVYINDSIALPTDEVKMAQWLAQHGPISIGINAMAMQFYFGGISHPWKIFCNPNKLDHGVLIVGFGTENDTPFWIIKNSWGASWGEKGYYRIYRGGGCCGLNQEPTSALVK